MKSTIREEGFALLRTIRAVSLFRKADIPKFTRCQACILHQVANACGQVSYRELCEGNPDYDKSWVFRNAVDLERKGLMESITEENLVEVARGDGKINNKTYKRKVKRISWQLSQNGIDTINRWAAELEKLTSESKS